MNRFIIRFLEGGYTEDKGNWSQMAAKYGHIARSIEIIKP